MTITSTAPSLSRHNRKQLEKRMNLTKLEAIDVQGRSRIDMGDLQALATSIERIGLLHPIVVTPDNKLVVGRRRLEAYKLLQRAEIPVNIATNLNDLTLLLEAERDENTARKAYTPEEAVHLGLRIEEVAKTLTKEAQRAGGKEQGGDKRSAHAKNNQGGGNSPKPKRDDSKRTTGQAALAVGLDRRTYEKAKVVVATGDRQLIAEMNRTGKVDGAYRKHVVQQKAAAIAAEPPPLPEGPFRVIVCDPPWPYDTRIDDLSHRGSLPYPSMSLAEITALRVAERAHQDCILWLWTTNAFLREAFDIAEAWGFTYKTTLTWAKNKMGLGDWLRGKTEHCLLCVRGQPVRQLTNQTTLLTADAGKHSAKPAAFYEMVEALCPGSKLEMFQRRARAGWTGHGDEAGAT
jgi:N6-adenosine-specific RNA methylase IME4/ParB-like chromosome segregation protein Spo0J